MAIRQFGCFGFVFALVIFPGTGFASCDNFYGNKDGVPSRHELEAQKILEDSKPAAEKDVEALALKCRSDVACLEKGLKAIFYENVKKQKKFWKAVDEKTNSSLCLKGGMGSAVHALAARSNYFKTAAIFT